MVHARYSRASRTINGLWDTNRGAGAKFRNAGCTFAPCTIPLISKNPTDKK
jgi:hypothetical protein